MNIVFDPSLWGSLSVTFPLPNRLSRICSDDLLVGFTVLRQIKRKTVRMAVRSRTGREGSSPLKTLQRVYWTTAISLKLDLTHLAERHIRRPDAFPSCNEPVTASDHRAHMINTAAFHGSAQYQRGYNATISYYLDYDGKREIERGAYPVNLCRRLGQSGSPYGE